MVLNINCHAMNGVDNFREHEWTLVQKVGKFWLKPYSFYQLLHIPIAIVDKSRGKSIRFSQMLHANLIFLILLNFRCCNGNHSFFAR